MRLAATETNAGVRAAGSCTREIPTARLTVFKVSAAPPLRIVSWNVQYLPSGRVEQLQTLFASLTATGSLPDVIVLIEVHLFNHELAGVHFDGFKVFGSLPVDTPSGVATAGIVTLVRDSLVAVPIPLAVSAFSPGSSDALCVSLPEMSPPLWVVGFYCPDARNFESFIGGVSKVFASAEARGVATVAMGDANVHGVYPLQPAPWSRVAPPGDGPPDSAARFFQQFLDGELSHHLTPTIVQTPAWSRRPQGSQRHRLRELDYAIACNRAVDFVSAAGVFPVGGSAFAEVTTDHRPVVLAFDGNHGPSRPVAPPVRRPPRRCVDWATATAEQKAAFEAFVGPRCDELCAALAEGFSMNDPLRRFDNDIEALLSRLLTFVIQPGEAAVELVTSRRASASGLSNHRWRTREVVESNRAVSKLHAANVTAVEAPVPDLDLIDSTASVLREARASHLELCKEAQAAAAIDLLLLVPPGGHEARRLHSMLRAIVRDGTRDSPTHIFEALQLDDKVPVATDPAEVDRLLRQWMATRHAENANDPDFDEAAFAEATREQLNWTRHACDPQCTADSVSATDFARWDRFEKDFDDPAVPTPSISPETWRAYKGSYCRVGEIETAVFEPGSDVSPSPEDGVSYSPLKYGGPKLWALLSMIFSAVIATGKIPRAWSCGFIRWLWKGKGSRLDPSNFRGITLTSCIGKTFERVLLRRILRWTRFIGAVPSVQSVSQVYSGVLEQLGLFNDMLADRTSRKRPTWVAAVDLKGAFPSTCRAFLWKRLREMGMGGACLRVLVGLFVNDCRVGGLPGGGFTERVSRASGVPEGFVLSPLLFAIALSDLVKDLKASSKGVYFAGYFAAALLFVDDIVLLASSFEDLRSLLEITVRWCQRRRFIVHPDKLEVMAVGAIASAEALARGGRLQLDVDFGAGRRNFTADVTISAEMRYLGPRFRSDLLWDSSIRRARAKSGKYIGGIARTMEVVGGISRDRLFCGFTASGRTVVEWACPVWGKISPPVWKLMEERDHQERLRLLGPASYGSSREAAAFLLKDLPLDLRVAARAAISARRHVGVVLASPLRQAVIAQLLRGAKSGFNGLAFSSHKRVSSSLLLLNLEWPRPEDEWSRNEWKNHVRRIAEAALWTRISARPSLALLSKVRPSKDWISFWITGRPARGDPSSDVLVALLGSSWQLFTDVRAKYSRNNSPQGAPVPNCDICALRWANSVHRGDAPTTLLRCPLLASPTRDWLSRAEAVCFSAGPLVVQWFKAHAEDPAPSTTTLAAIIFAIGAPVAPGRAFANLQDDLTSAFAVPYGSVHSDSVGFVRRLQTWRDRELSVGADDELHFDPDDDLAADPLEPPEDSSSDEDEPWLRDPLAFA